MEGLRLIENLEISFDVAAGRKDDGGTSLDLSEVAEAIEAALKRLEGRERLEGIAHFLLDEEAKHDHVGHLATTATTLNTSTLQVNIYKSATTATATTATASKSSNLFHCNNQTETSFLICDMHSF